MINAGSTDKDDSRINQLAADIRSIYAATAQEWVLWWIVALALAVAALVWVGTEVYRSGLATVLLFGALTVIAGLAVLVLGDLIRDNIRARDTTRKLQALASRTDFTRREMYDAACGQPEISRMSWFLRLIDPARCAFDEVFVEAFGNAYAALQDPQTPLGICFARWSRCSNEGEKLADQDKTDEDAWRLVGVAHFWRALIFATCAEQRRSYRQTMAIGSGSIRSSWQTFAGWSVEATERGAPYFCPVPEERLQELRTRMERLQVLSEQAAATDPRHQLAVVPEGGHWLGILPGVTAKDITSYAEDLGVLSTMMGYQPRPCRGPTK